MTANNDNVYSLFIGDLSKFCNEAELERLFCTFGPVLDVKIKRNNNTGKTLSYGFVTFADESAATLAMEQLDDTMFFGRRLRIRWAMYNARSQNPINESVINSVYVRFSTPRLDKFVTEEDLHSVFDKFGCVQDVSIKESSTDKSGGQRQSGYGFVHFSCDTAGIEAAFQAVQNVDNGTFQGVTYNVELSKNLLKQFKELQMQQNAGRGSGGGRGHNNDLHTAGGSAYNTDAHTGGGGGAHTGGGGMMTVQNKPQFNNIIVDSFSSAMQLRNSPNLMNVNPNSLSANPNPNHPHNSHHSHHNSGQHSYNQGSHAGGGGGHSGHNNSRSFAAGHMHQMHRMDNNVPSSSPHSSHSNHSHSHGQSHGGQGGGGHNNHHNHMVPNHNHNANGGGYNPQMNDGSAHIAPSLAMGQMYNSHQRNDGHRGRQYGSPYGMEQDASFSAPQGYNQGFIGTTGGGSHAHSYSHHSSSHGRGNHNGHNNRPPHVYVPHASSKSTQGQGHGQRQGQGQGRGFDGPSHSNTHYSQSHHQSSDMHGNVDGSDGINTATSSPLPLDSVSPRSVSPQNTGRIISHPYESYRVDSTRSVLSVDSRDRDRDRDRDRERERESYYTQPSSHHQQQPSSTPSNTSTDRGNSGLVVQASSQDLSSSPHAGHNILPGSFVSLDTSNHSWASSQSHHSHTSHHSHSSAGVILSPVPLAGTDSGEKKLLPPGLTPPPPDTVTDSALPIPQSLASSGSGSPQSNGGTDGSDRSFFESNLHSLDTSPHSRHSHLSHSKSALATTTSSNNSIASTSLEAAMSSFSLNDIKAGNSHYYDGASTQGGSNPSHDPFTKPMQRTCPIVLRGVSGAVSVDGGLDAFDRAKRSSDIGDFDHGLSVGHPPRMTMPTRGHPSHQVPYHSQHSPPTLHRPLDENFSRSSHSNPPGYPSYSQNTALHSLSGSQHSSGHSSGHSSLSCSLHSIGSGKDGSSSLHGGSGSSSQHGPFNPSTPYSGSLYDDDDDDSRQLPFGSRRGL